MTGLLALGSIAFLPARGKTTPCIVPVSNLLLSYQGLRASVKAFNTKNNEDIAAVVEVDGRFDYFYT